MSIIADSFSCPQHRPARPVRRPLKRAGVSCLVGQRPTQDQRAVDDVAWARSMTAMPAWVFATAHDLTLEQAERIQEILADLAEKAEGGL
jgi:hypothetical protein